MAYRLIDYASRVEHQERLVPYLRDSVGDLKSISKLLIPKYYEENRDRIKFVYGGDEDKFVKENKFTIIDLTLLKLETAELNGENPIMQIILDLNNQKIAAHGQSPNGMWIVNMAIDLEIKYVKHFKALYEDYREMEKSSNHNAVEGEDGKICKARIRTRR